MDKKDIENVLNGMFDTIKKEEIELYKKIINHSEISKFDDAESFYFAVLYPWKKFINGILGSVVSDNDDVKFIYKNSQYIDRHFKRLFERFEGVGCSADKSRTIINSLIYHYKTGNKIEFDYDAEYTFNLPQKILKLHNDIVSFYEGLKNLYYADSRKYLEELKKILKSL